MIIFHEGMPRSGKSYEAMALQIIPALQKGRPVDAYIEGLNFERIAECAELPLERVRELLQQLTADQVPEFHKHIRPNALVVLDEVQDFWPTGRIRLDAATTKAITQHGHLGQDFLLMGQVLSDVHKLWRGRVSQKNFYLKLEAVGMENRYSVTVYKASRPERFEKVTFGQRSYDSKYFGTYASHLDSSISTANFQDKRAKVTSTFFVRWTVPIVLGLAVWGAWVVYRYFHPVAVAPKPTAVGSAASGAAAASGVAGVVRVADAAPKPKKPFVLELNDKYRPRLSMVYAVGGGKWQGVVEWWDGGNLRERLTFAQIHELGAEVVVRGEVAMIAGTWATPWPLVSKDPTPASTAAPAVTAVGSALGG